MRSSIHATAPPPHRPRRERQRGFALIAAIVLAVLYFGLMELILIESDLQLAQAQRFRSRTVAATLAESAAELAAEKIVTGAAAGSQWKNADGTMTWDLKRTETNFEVVASGTSTGVRPETATVRIQGRLTPTLHIDWTEHSQ